MSFDLIIRGGTVVLQDTNGVAADIAIKDERIAAILAPGTAADARETLRRNSEPFTIYQVAGIYALTSRQEPADRREAFHLLESTLNRGFGLNLIEQDRDLDAIRDQPEFRQLVEAARVRRSRGTPRPGKPQADFQPHQRAKIEFLADGAQRIRYS